MTVASSKEASALVRAAPDMLVVLERVNSELASAGRIECGTDLACRVSEVIAQAKGAA